MPALLQLCRQVYLEASPVYFSENQFVLTVNIPPIAFYPKPLHSRVHRVVIPSWIKSLEEIAPVQMRNVKVEIDLAYKLGVVTMGGDAVGGGGGGGRLRIVEAWIHNGRQKLPLGSMREAVSAYLDYTIDQKLEVDEDMAGLNYREVILIASKMLRQWAGTIVPA